MDRLMAPCYPKLSGTRHRGPANQRDGIAARSMNTVRNHHFIIDSPTIGQDTLLILRQCHEVRHRAGGAHAGFAAVIVEGDQPLLEPPGAHPQAARAAELIGHRAGDAVAARRGVGVPCLLGRAHERIILRPQAVDEREGQDDIDGANTIGGLSSGIEAVIS